MESETVRVLMVDDSDTDFILFSKMLRAVPNRKFQVDWVSKFDQAIETIQKNTHDIYFFDYRLGPRSGLELMREAFRPESMPPVILLTGFGDYEVDVEAMRLGASDFLNKNSLDSSTLERAIRYAFDRKESRDTLQKKNLLLSSILENMGEGVAMTDMSGNLIFFNQNAERILGSGPNLGTSESWSQEYGIYLLDRQTPYPAEELPLARALKGEVVTDMELFIRNKNVPLGIYLNVRSRPLRNDEGVIVGAVTVFRDVTAIKAAEEQLIRHSLYCSVTHLPNRQLFSDRVEQSIRRLKKDTAEPFTVFIMSLGGFQKITDTFGKDAGDRILKGAGRRLEDLVANGDTVAHLESNDGRTEAGDVQVMSAGSGVRHSEYNLEDETTRLFQIWIEPTERGGKPSWGAKQFPKGDRSGRFVTLASGFDDDADALRIRTDARVMGATIKAGERVTLTIDPARHAYLVPATGVVDVGGLRIEARDGAAITDVATFDVVGIEDAEVVLVETA